KYNLIQTIHHYDYALELSNRNTLIRSHINVDTGMSRFGIYLHHSKEQVAVVQEIQKIGSLPNVLVEGLYTHFADADNPDSNFTEYQYQLFASLSEELHGQGLHDLVLHACNSSATIRFPKMHMNMVRCGIAMYGYPQVKTKLDLQPCMSVFGKVTDLRVIHIGDTVSYVRQHEAKEDEVVATISIGYADGYLRANTNKDFFLYQGKYLHQIGKVCMDAMMVNATGTDLKIGQFIEIFGKNKTATVVAKHTKTIEYEVLTNLSSRVKRFYLK
ncbi:MAG: alanine racemase, partial [Candidatus Izemoplasmatales bacterium]|nr:alanine racemase [Candidatus Izemoplasmatales bacterium]